jgi:hypothetical protein
MNMGIRTQDSGGGYNMAVQELEETPDGDEHAKHLVRVGLQRDVFCIVVFIILGYTVLS